MSEEKCGLEGWGPTAARLALGVIFLAHGSQKMLGWFGGYGWSATIGFFKENLGIPAVLAALVILIEFFGGLAVVLGVCTRPAAAALAVVMLGAIATVHWRNGFFMNWYMEPDKGHGIEMNLALLGLALSLVFSGSGRLAVRGCCGTSCCAGGSCGQKAD
jgi:putative oxidoreductase